MKKLLVILCLVITFPVFGQKISFYRSPLDSVAMKMDELFDGRVFFVPDTSGTAKVTVRVDDPSLFVEEAVNALKGIGYSVTMQDGNMFILKGVASQ